jgi:diguanylate cyclase (GGDEF)-like protein
VVRDRSGVAKQRIGGDPGDDGYDHGREEEERWLARYAEEQSRTAEDQTESDDDQTASDADQSLSDLDRELSERDQLASDSDQRASDRDQDASDQELRRHPDEASRRAHEAGRASRQAGALERDQASQVRALSAEERAGLAALRDESAWKRDRTAETRDSAAERRDRHAVALERKLAARGSSLNAALELATQTRLRAAEDRARAAEDRAQAAFDRERAANERAEVLAELRHAHVDDLTGALRRGAGDRALVGEIERAKRDDGQLVLAFVDVDSLREVNNRDGHPAGDVLLRSVVSAIRSNMRSYEPIVRYGGDEFVCAMSGIDIAQAEKRFVTIRGALSGDGLSGAISVGLAELRPEDGLTDLVERADTAMLDARRGHLPGGD